MFDLLHLICVIPEFMCKVAKRPLLTILLLWAIVTTWLAFLEREATGVTVAPEQEPPERRIVHVIRWLWEKE